MLNVTSKQKQDMMDEIKHMKAMPYPFIVKIIDEFIDSTGNQCIIQESYSEGDFSHFLEKKKEKQQLFSEEEILHFLAKIIMVVFHIIQSRFITEI